MINDEIVYICILSRSNCLCVLFSFFCLSYRYRISLYFVVSRYFQCKLCKNIKFKFNFKVINSSCAKLFSCFLFFFSIALQKKTYLCNEMKWKKKISLKKKKKQTDSTFCSNLVLFRFSISFIFGDWEANFFLFAAFFFDWKLKTGSILIKIGSRNSIRIFFSFCLFQPFYFFLFLCVCINESDYKKR